MAEQRISVGFFCQRCLQPIKLDDTFSSIGEHNLAELSLPIHTAPEVDLESPSGSIDHLIPAYHLVDSGNGGTNGFTILSTQGEPGSLSHKLKVAADLFDIVSSNSEVDHPLCEECTDTLLDLLDQQLKVTEDELSDYCQYHKKLLNEDQNVDMEALTKELEDLKAEEARLFSELKAVKEEESKIIKDLEEQEKVRERLDRDEELYWKEYSKHRNEFILIEDEHKSLECQLAYAQAHLDKLKKTNVFNATFHIWHSGGHFGTINNFRLGRLPSAPVEWSEINAAWGQTALLLNALAKKMNLKFDKYKLVPYGNHSFIEVIAEQKELPLSASGGIRFLWDTKFDSAMVAFLDCLQQFKEEVEKADSGFCLPYKIDKGKFEDAHGNSYSIKIQFNSEEQWTKALKFLLTNLKWGLAWVSSQFNKE